MALPFPPLMTGDDHADLEALHDYFYSVIDAFTNAVGQAIDGSVTDGSLGPGGDGALTITEAPTDIVYTASSGLSLDQTLFGAIAIEYTLPNRAIGLLIHYREQGETVFKTSFANNSPERLINLKVGISYDLRLAGQASNGSIGPFSPIVTVMIPVDDAVMKAPASVQYLIAEASVQLPDARVATDSNTVVWDFTTDNEATASVPDAAITTDKLANAAVTYVKMQQASAAKVLLGAEAAGVYREITLAALFTIVSGVLSVVANSGWSTSGITTDKVLASGDTLLQTQNVLGTLIDTLKTQGILSA